MIIANPLYDVVFKYLLEDMDIAREMLATILQEDIVSIEVKAQETVMETSASSVSILRFDFKAVIRTATGELKKVLIELQMAKQVLDAMRFRRYLGDNYRKEDQVMNSHGVIVSRPLPLATIYFLGFKLDHLSNAAVKINREYTDLLTGKKIEAKEDFVELLSHDSYFIQIPYLKAQTQTALERVLQVFSPEFRTKDKHQLDFKGNADDPLVRKMVDRLGRAIASDEMRDKMDVEDEIDRIMEREIKKATDAKDEVIAEKDVVIAEREEVIAVKNEVIAKKDEVIAEKDEVIAEKEKALAEKDEALAEKEKATAADREQIETLLRQIEDLKKFRNS